MAKNGSYYHEQRKARIYINNILGSVQKGREVDYKNFLYNLGLEFAVSRRFMLDVIEETLEHYGLAIINDFIVKEEI